MQISGDCPLRWSFGDRVLSDILNETMSIYIDVRIQPEWKWPNHTELVSPTEQQNVNVTKRTDRIVQRFDHFPSFGISTFVSKSLNYYTFDYLNTK